MPPDTSRPCAGMRPGLCAMAFSATLDECGAIRPAATRARVTVSGRGVVTRLGREPSMAAAMQGCPETQLNVRFCDGLLPKLGSNHLSLHPLPCWSIPVGVYLYE